MLCRSLPILSLAAGVCFAAGNMAFTVSMPQPASHTYHVTLRCDGLKGELQDFKMPQWSPGYYWIADYARNVSNFRAEDAAGHALPWEKVTRNTWRVVASNAPVVVLNYEMLPAVTTNRPRNPVGIPGIRVQESAATATLPSLTTLTAAYWERCSN